MGDWPLPWIHVPCRIVFPFPTNSALTRAMIIKEGDGMTWYDTLNEEIAIIIEQYADHAETRLPGMGPKCLAPTPYAAVNQLMEWLNTQSTPMLPVAVSLLNIPRNTFDLRPPTVVYAPDGVMALFSGDLDPVEPPPPEATWLKPGENALPTMLPTGAHSCSPTAHPHFTSTVPSFVAIMAGIGSYITRAGRCYYPRPDTLFRGCIDDKSRP